MPSGWTLYADGELVSSPAPAERKPWFASDIDVDVEPTTVSADTGTLLSRAFNGPAGRPTVITPDELEARRLARLERVESNVDGAPESLRDRVEQQGNDDGNHHSDRDQRADRNVGSGENGPNDHHDEHQPERDDRVEAYGTDELPFPPLEPEATTRAAIG